MRLRSWRELIHDGECPECDARWQRELMRDRLTVLYPEPTQEEIDAWLGIPDDWSVGAE